MKIDTKYNIGDEVWFPFGGKPYKSKVKAIYIYHINGNIYVRGELYGQPRTPHLFLPGRTVKKL